MSQKRTVVRDRSSGGVSDLQLQRRERDAAKKLQQAQQVEQLENRVSTLTDAAKRAASENSKLLNRVAQLDQKLNAAHAAPRFEEADAQAKSAWLSELTDESSSGFGATLEKVPVHANCTTA
jgi:flagellar motility protein MotE (MotC chaperone)